MADVSVPTSHSSADPSAPRRATRPTPAAGIAIVLGSAALFGTLGPLSHVAYGLGIEPSAWVAWRGAIGLLTLLAVIGWRARGRFTPLVRLARLSPRARATLLIGGLSGFALNMCIFAAFDRVTVALALLCFYTYPAMVAAVNVATGRERLDAPRIAALALALGGMVAVVASQLDPVAGIDVDAIGIAFAFGAALSQTVYVSVTRGYHDVPTDQAIAVVMSATVVGATIVTVLGGTVTALVEPLGTPGILPLLLFAGIFAAAIPSLGFLEGIRTIGGLRAGILMLFEPVVGVALAAWFLDERLAPIQVAGAVAILGAAVILQRTSSAADDQVAHVAVAVGGGP
jgi:drug/metabolite transporter (DMT)-like permease